MAHVGAGHHMASKSPSSLGRAVRSSPRIEREINHMLIEINQGTHSKDPKAVSQVQTPTQRRQSATEVSSESNATTPGTSLTIGTPPPPATDTLLDPSRGRSKSRQPQATDISARPLDSLHPSITYSKKRRFKPDQHLSGSTQRSDNIQEWSSAIASPNPNIATQHGGQQQPQRECVSTDDSQPPALSTRSKKRSRAIPEVDATPQTPSKRPQPVADRKNCPTIRGPVPKIHDGIPVWCTAFTKIPSLIGKAVNPFPPTNFVPPIARPRTREEIKFNHTAYSTRLDNARKKAAEAASGTKVTKSSFGLKDIVGKIKPRPEPSLDTVVPSKIRKPSASTKAASKFKNFHQNLHSSFAPMTVGPDEVQFAPPKKRSFTLADVMGTRDPLSPLFPNTELYRLEFLGACEDRHTNEDHVVHSLESILKKHRSRYEIIPNSTENHMYESQGQDEEVPSARGMRRNGVR